MKAQHRRFSFSAIAAAIIAIVLLSVIAAHAINSGETHSVYATNATVQR